MKAPHAVSFMDDNLHDFEAEEFHMFLESADLDYESDFGFDWDTLTVDVLFGVEQSCDDDGRLLPRSVRGAWLRRFSRRFQEETEALLVAMPYDARDELVWVFFSTIRFARARVTGNPRLQLPSCFPPGLTCIDHESKPVP